MRSRYLSVCVVLTLGACTSSQSCTSPEVKNAFIEEFWKHSKIDDYKMSDQLNPEILKLAEANIKTLKKPIYKDAIEHCGRSTNFSNCISEADRQFKMSEVAYNMEFTYALRDQLSRIKNDVNLVIKPVIEDKIPINDKPENTRCVYSVEYTSKQVGIFSSLSYFYFKKTKNGNIFVSIY